MDLGVGGQSYVLLGGSRGLGYEAARVLAAEGARLTLISRTAEQVEAAAATLAAEFGAETLALTADAMAVGQVDAAIARSIERFGAPRGLLVTSGLTYHNGTILDLDDADWEHNFQDVLMGTVRAVRAALPAMIAAGGGQVVTTGAFSARAAKPFLFPYAALKAAIINFTKNLAKTYGGQGIRANCVCPGAFATVRVNERIDEAMAAQGLSRQAAAGYVMREVFRMPVALDRPGEAREAGELMAFLLSERAGYMTGAIVNIDGGTDF
jgi:3-oxoacyl-[acyl-carrier protein] reductase